MLNKGIIAEVRIDETVGYCLFFFFDHMFLKQLIAFSSKDAFLQGTEICSSKFNLLSIFIRNSFTDFDMLVVMFLIFNVILVLLFLFPFCITIARNLSGLVDTGRKLNVHKTFKRRPGRLLNVLCTFNLRPVPTELLSYYFL